MNPRPRCPHLVAPILLLLAATACEGQSAGAAEEDPAPRIFACVYPTGPVARVALEAEQDSPAACLRTVFIQHETFHQQSDIAFPAGWGLLNTVALKAGRCPPRDRASEISFTPTGTIAEGGFVGVDEVTGTVQFAGQTKETDPRILFHRPTELSIDLQVGIPGTTATAHIAGTVALDLCRG